ncbi:hypothetical protein [Bradyrhizobium sp. ERR14]|uniref:hypothetical protein n=1 Tax=Bradyrhizobium sp. ERR14 TaxID=2663837 RepID=UPI0018201052|nr:hypothetical protein [Bradyrhizobium sp. ERR14]MBB4398066.1 hypothetical protein [Bradyrhizobium sp. ERR14]
MTATAIALQQPVSGVDAEVAVAAVRIALRHDMGFARIRVSYAELPGGIERRRGIASVTDFASEETVAACDRDSHRLAGAA